MAKKKTEEKEVKDIKSDFDFETALASMEAPEMLKAGFRYYVKVNDITFQSEKELEKFLEKFKQMN